MTRFVLVHGGWHGGWCWRKLTPILRAAGHDAYPVTLTGLGEREHLGSPDVSLDTHIADVVGTLHYEDLANVVLVGHSLGGTVVSGVADRAPDQVAHLVYLDATVLRDGECDLDVHTQPQADFIRQRVDPMNGWGVEPIHRDQPFGIINPTDAAWLNARLRPHPLRSFTDPLRLSRPDAFAGARTYIRCTGHRPGEPPSVSAERARREPGWDYRELDTGHDAMVTAPDQLADMLLSLVDTAAYRR